MPVTMCDQLALGVAGGAARCGWGAALRCAAAVTAAATVEMHTRCDTLSTIRSPAPHPPLPVRPPCPPSTHPRPSGNYIDHKCPFTGNVSIRGRILTGLVRSTKMNRTIVVRRDYLHFIKKYQRYEKRHANISAHISPCFRCHEGDTVVIGQCRCAARRALGGGAGRWVAGRWGAGRRALGGAARGGSARPQLAESRQAWMAVAAPSAGPVSSWLVLTSF